MAALDAGSGEEEMEAETEVDSVAGVVEKTMVVDLDESGACAVQ
jgi:hypothetical protein